MPVERESNLVGKQIIKQQDPAEQRRNETLLDRLGKIFSRAKFKDKEITPEKNAKDELPPDTGSEELMHKSFSEVISGYVSEARNLEEDRFIRYRDYEQMCYNPVIAGATEIYADESTQKNEKGDVITIKAKDKKTEKMIRELFYDKLKLNEIIWKVAYEMVKYGDTFYEMVFNKKLDDILYLKFVSPYRLFRVEENGKLKGYKYLESDKNIFTTRESEAISTLMKYNDKLKDRENLIEPYKIVQFKMDDNKFYPYGRGVLDAPRVAWKQMKLLEDAVMVYRLARSPIRRVWKIDVGLLSPDKAFAYVTKIKNMVRKKPIIDPTTGRVTDTLKAISMVEDFWIPVRQGQTSTDITEIGGTVKMGDVDDLQYWREQILFYMRIPKAYLADDVTAQMSGKTLSQLDVFFARAVEKVQTFIENGLYKIAYVYMILKKIQPDKIKTLKITLTSPSYYKETQKLEFLTAKFQQITSIQGMNLFPNVYIMKEYLNLSDEEIIAITGLMQAQTAGADMIAVLTGKNSPFVPTQPGAEGQPGAGGPPGPEAQQMGAEMEKGLGGTPPEQGQVTPPTPEQPQPVGTPPTGAEGEESMTPPTAEKVMTPNELAIRALLNFESVQGDKKQKQKILLEALDSLIANNKDIKSKQRKLLNYLEEKKENEEYQNGFSNTVATGELGGLVNDIRKSEQKNDIMNEQKMEDSKLNAKNFLEKVKKIRPLPPVKS